VKAGTLKDGFGIAITFGVGESGTNHGNVMLKLDPTSITPPGVDGGDPIDTVTHSNSEVRTKHPKSLKDLTNTTLTVAYDPNVWTEIVALVNDNVLITLSFPSGDALDFYGYLKSFVPGEYVEGEQPTAECEIEVTNWDHATGLESGPSLTAASA
jgi:hypothetical protein